VGKTEKKKEEKKEEAFTPDFNNSYPASSKNAKEASIHNFRLKGRKKKKRKKGKDHDVHHPLKDNAETYQMFGVSERWGGKRKREELVTSLMEIETTHSSSEKRKKT